MVLFFVNENKSFKAIHVKFSHIIELGDHIYTSIRNQREDIVFHGKHDPWVPHFSFRNI